MKTKQKLHRGTWAAVFAFLALPASMQAGSFVTDFNSGMPSGCAVYGNATVSANGGLANSGCLQLTTALLDQNGAFAISDDLDLGAPVISFTARFKALIGGSSDRWNFANGFSFNFASDVPLGTVGFPESGVGSGLTVGFETTPPATPATRLLPSSRWVRMNQSWAARPLLTDCELTDLWML